MMRGVGIAAMRARLNAGAQIAAQRIRHQPASAWIARNWARLLDEAGALLAPVIHRLAPETRLVAVPRPDEGFDLTRITRGRVTPVTPSDQYGRAERVELRLRSDQVLERSLTLPAASRDYLATIVEHRLDRLTPWRRDAVVHGFATSGTSDDGATLTVCVLMTSAEIVDPLLVALQARGLTVIAIGALADAPEQPLPIILGRGTAAQHRPAWLVAGCRLWLAGTSALAVLAVATSLWASAASDHQLEADRHLAKARRLIRNAASGPLDGADQQWLAAKQPDAATVVLIDRLASALPDTAYLREMALTPADVRLVGTAADAAALIPILEGTGLSNVRFTSPVARGEDRRDSFEITADRASAREAAP